ncbi:MAG: NAD(P)-dependent oxidoreductase [Candidatus Omnitrophica bacterium]|nr:NAD(P)-dependent oxidoreductase [Candidatus Omnitrophota bacterium]
MEKKVLLLGSTGKVGTACAEIFKEGYVLVGKNSQDFDAVNFDQVRTLLELEKPDIVINTVAFLGIDPSEKKPVKAFQLNALYPQLLAQLSAELGFVLVHFSTDGVFDDQKNDFYVESDMPRPLNVYGATKYCGDCFIQSLAKEYYVFRIPTLFGESPKNDQFVEKMFQKIQDGASTLRIAGDVISSPSYSKDIAARVCQVIETNQPWGIYHVANEGKTSLYELMQEIVKNLGMDVVIEKASFNDFPYVARKNTNTPITSEKLEPMRPWTDAVKDYCDSLKILKSVK